jgi:hypothetical protein
MVSNRDSCSSILRHSNGNTNKKKVVMVHPYEKAVESIEAMAQGDMRCRSSLSVSVLLLLPFMESDFKTFSDVGERLGKDSFVTSMDP